MKIQVNKLHLEMSDSDFRLQTAMRMLQLIRK